MRLFLQRIGPLDEAQLILQKSAILYGPNGSGKTTVARALGFVIRILRGGGLLRLRRSR
jgi:AAA15 family ATPase/GTPase